MKRINKFIFFLCLFFIAFTTTHAQSVTTLLNYGNTVSGIGGTVMAVKGDKVYILFTASLTYKGRICCYDMVTKASTWSGDLFPTIAQTDVSHNCPAIAIDGSGYIHVWIGMHNLKMKYWRSNAPGDITNFTNYSPQMPGYNDTGLNEKRYSYPAAVTASNGDVFVILRRTALGGTAASVGELQQDEKQDLYHWNNQTKSWSVSLVLQQKGKNAYMSNLYGDQNNNIHIVTAWSQLHYGNNTFQRGTYLKYNNSQNTYSKANGTVVTIPAGVDTNPADVFYPGELPWGDTICEIQTPTVNLNGEGKPVITVPYNPSYSKEVPIYELNIIRFDGTGWVRQRNVYSGVKNCEHPPLTYTSKQVNVYSRNSFTGNLLQSKDNGASFSVNTKLTSGSEPEVAIQYNSSTDVYLTPYALYKVVYPQNTDVNDLLLNSESDFRVYLNFSQQTLFLKNISLLQNKEYTTSVFSMDGRELISLNKYVDSIDVSPLPVGNYCVQVVGRFGRWSAKFSKQY